MAGRGFLLVADDDPEILRVLTKVLVREGYQALGAASGDEAMAVLRETPAVQVLITDIRMPGMDGITLLRQALALRPELKVVLVTAFGDMEECYRVMEMGAYEYLTKPFKIPELLEVLDRALDSGTSLSRS